MGMTILKIHFHLRAAIKKFFYKLFFGKSIHFGNKTTFRKNFNLYIEKGAKVTFGDNCFFNNSCSVNSLDSITIGDGCIFGEGVKLYDHNHKFSDLNVPIKKQGFSKAPIKIGHDCWICSNVTILKGVTIGNNCVIGAGCLVYKDIPDNSIVKNSSNLIAETIKGR